MVSSGKLLPQPNEGPNGGPKSPFKYNCMILNDKNRCSGGDEGKLRLKPFFPLIVDYQLLR